jgi:hypothetical protein
MLLQPKDKEVLLFLEHMQLFIQWQYTIPENLCSTAVRTTNIAYLMMAAAVMDAVTLIINSSV